METKIEDWFFAYFKEKGLVSKCIDLMNYKYDLGETPHNIPKDKIQLDEDDIKDIKKDLHRLGQIKLVYNKPTLLTEEINQNIKSCSGQELDDYIFSLLQSFKILSELENPIGKLKKLELEYMEAVQNDSDVNLIKKLSDKIVRVKAQRKIYNGIGIFCTSEEQEPECTLACLFWKKELFFYFLDAFLLPLHLDIFKYQCEIDIYLCLERDLDVLEPMIGGDILDAIQYITEVDTRKPQQGKLFPTKLTDPKVKGKLFPTKLTDPTAKEIFGKAIEAGYMKKAKDKDGYVWNMNKALLAYLISRLCCSKNKSVDFFPNDAACRLFSTKNLKQSVNAYVGNTGGKPKGFESIDDLFK